MQNNRAALWQLVISMLIWGSLGLIRRHIDLPSSFICFCRALLGGIFILGFLKFTKQSLDFTAIRKHFAPLFIAGICLGTAWTFLFEAFSYTSVAVAILVFYMQPLMLIAVSPWCFGEKITWKGLVCIGAAVLGMVLVSGILETGFKGWEEMRGVACAFAGAIFYAAIVVFNKKVEDIGVYDKTLVNFFGTVCTLGPLCYFTVPASVLEAPILSWTLVLLLAIVHTGIAMVLFYGSVTKLDAQTVALVSYFDPVSSVIFAAVLLGEKLTWTGCVGAILILGSTLLYDKWAKA